jgi:hypothetical protein
MAYPAQRSRFQPPRELVVLLLVVGAVLAVVFWIGPFRPILPDVGRAGEPRFPLVLALENRGGRVARPVSVSLSLPAVFRVRSNQGPLEREAAAGNPLVRYRLPVPERRVVPGAPPELLTPGDTLWLEPNLSDYYCTTLSDSVPEFVPSPDLSASRLADLQVFYSFAERRYRGREAGLLALQLDSTGLAHRPAAMPPTFPTQVREPEIARPELGRLRDAGSRRAECGDPEQPLELYTVNWETAGGGRFLVVYLNGAPRKQLFDLDRDSIIELEVWDPDADGRFEARRAARYAIPPFLLPERPAELVAADSVLDSPGWQVLFADTARGPFRFTPDSLLPPALKPESLVPAGAIATPPPVTAPPATAPPAVAEVPVADSGFVRRFNDVGQGPFRFLPDSLLPTVLRRRTAQVDSTWLRRFNDVAAGPFRFSENPPPLRARPSSGTPPRGPVPLGTPLPDYPRPRGRNR